MKIKTIPSLKETMYVFGKTIHVSYGFLETLPDDILKTSFLHEEGHVINFCRMFFLVVLSSLFFIELSLLVPIIFFPLLFVICYCWLCFISRYGEFHADEYAFQQTGKDSMIEFINSLNSDPHWIWIPFRYHPSKEKRIKLINRLDERRKNNAL